MGARAAGTQRDPGRRKRYDRRSRDSLEALGALDTSTGCGNPLDQTPDTPLGPR